MKFFLSLPLRGRVAAGGGRVGRADRQRGFNSLQDARKIAVNIAIPKSKDAESRER
ncbi:MAG: hypothetical protein OJF62_002132 [Pseudolabrys sp.]|nr:hypothetical protein [Pseudolabrys sp.]